MSIPKEVIVSVGCLLVIYPVFEVFAWCNIGEGIFKVRREWGRPKMYNNKEGATMGTEVVGKLVLVGDDGVLVKPLCESSTVLDFGLMSHIAISIDHHVEVPNSCEGGVVQTKSMADLIVSSKDQNVEHVNVDGQASAKHSSDVSPKTSSKDGMDTMLENDSWLIRNVLLTLEKWSPNANLMKEGVCDGYLGTIRIEYAWKPPDVYSCKVLVTSCSSSVVISLPLKKKVNLNIGSMPSTFMEYQVEESDSEVDVLMVTQLVYGFCG
ncbi:hypothetical protein Tco_0547802 [Tanacetum coccineum]